MSLILRQKTEGLLEKAGLGEFHTQISNKYMQVVGQCGQPIVTVRGIMFSKNAPSIAEIDYSVGLFAKFLETHKDKLAKYKAVRKSQKAEAITDDEALVPIKAIKGLTNILLRNYGSPQIHYSYRLGDKALTFNTTTSFTTDNISHYFTSNVTIDEYKEILKVLTKVDKAAKAVFESIAKRTADTAALQAIKADLAKCDI